MNDENELSVEEQHPDAKAVAVRATSDVLGIPAVQEHCPHVVVDPFAPVMTVRHSDGEQLARDNEGLRLQVAELERALVSQANEHASYRERAEDTRRALEQRIVSLESVQRGYADEIMRLRNNGTVG